MIAEIWHSFQSLPLAVRLWMALVLMPVNLLSLYFVSEPWGLWVAMLAISAMAMNLPVLIVERGFSKLMAIPHLLPWTLLVIGIFWLRPEGTEPYGLYLWVLAGVNIVSLYFDYPDSYRWLKGDRAVAGNVDVTPL